MNHRNTCILFLLIYTEFIIISYVNRFYLSPIFIWIKRISLMFIIPDSISIPQYNLSSQDRYNNVKTIVYI